MHNLWGRWRHCTTCAEEKQYQPFLRPPGRTKGSRRPARGIAAGPTCSRGPSSPFTRSNKKRTCSTVSTCGRTGGTLWNSAQQPLGSSTNCRKLRQSALPKRLLVHIAPGPFAAVAAAHAQLASCLPPKPFLAGSLPPRLPPHHTSSSTALTFGTTRASGRAAPDSTASKSSSQCPLCTALMRTARSLRPKLSSASACWFGCESKPVS